MDGKMNKAKISEDERNLSESVAATKPSYWQVKHLGDITFESKNRNNNLRFSRKNVLAVNNQQGLVPSDRNLGDDFSRYKIVEESCFAYNPMRLNVGSIGLWKKPEHAIVSPDYMVFKCCQNDLLPEFLDFFRMGNSWKAQIKLSGQGSIRIRYYFQHIARFDIPLPPLPEQRAISRLLEAVKQARETRLHEIALERERKAALMEHLFTHGTRGEPTKQTEIGEMPESWHLAIIDELKAPIKGSLVAGPFGSNIGKRFFVENGVPVIRGNNLTKGYKHFIDEGFVFITEEKAKELKSCISIYNDLIFTAAGTLGQIGIIPAKSNYQKYIISNKQIRLRVNESVVCPLYLFYWISNPTIQYLIKKANSGTSIPVLNLGVVKRLPVPIPMLYEQNEIISIIQAFDSKITTLDNEAQLLDELFRAMLEELMTGKLSTTSLIETEAIS